MSDDFDPYYIWLGIPPDEQPPNYYRLLGVRLFEPDAEVIDSVSLQRIRHVRTAQTGARSRLSQTILNELAAARACLLNPQRKAAYDEDLRARLGLPPTIAGSAQPVAHAEHADRGLSPPPTVRAPPDRPTSTRPPDPHRRPKSASRSRSARPKTRRSVLRRLKVAWHKIRLPKIKLPKFSLPKISLSRRTFGRSFPRINIPWRALTVAAVMCVGAFVLAGGVYLLSLLMSREAEVIRGSDRRNHTAGEERQTATSETPIAMQETPIATQQNPIAAPEAPIAMPEAPIAMPENPIATLRNQIEAIAATQRAPIFVASDLSQLTLKHRCEIPTSGLIRSLEFYPDGKFLAANVNGIRLWSLEANSFQKVFAGICSDFAISPDGRLLALVGQGGGVKLLNAQTGASLGTVKQGIEMSEVVISQDGDTLLSRRGDEISDFALGVPSRETREYLTHHRPSDIAVTPDGGLCAAGHLTGFELWKLDSGNALWNIRCEYGAGRVAFSTDGKTLAASGRLSVDLWDIDSKTLRCRLAAPGSPAAVFHPGMPVVVTGEHVFTGEFRGNTGVYRGRIAMWDATSGKLLRQYHRDDVTKCIAVSADGRILATCDLFKIQIWDIELGQLSPIPEATAGPRNQTPVDFQDQANGKIDDQLTGLPSGNCELGGVEFEIGPGVLQPGRASPYRITGISVGRKVNKLHFLHATQGGAKQPPASGQTGDASFELAQVPQ